MIASEFQQIQIFHDIDLKMDSNVPHNDNDDINVNEWERNYNPQWVEPYNSFGAEQNNHFELQETVLNNTLQDRSRGDQEGSKCQRRVLSPNMSRDEF